MFEPKFKVGILTGDRKIDTDANILIATTEIYRNELYKVEERYSLVVFDEVHYIADPQRGAVWEESIILSAKEAALLMLSASISNADEIAAWLKEVRGKECNVVYKYDRPVELRYGFLHPDFGPIPLNDKKGNVCKDVLDYYGKAGLDSSGMKFTRISFRKAYKGDEGWRRKGKTSRRTKSNFKGKGTQSGKQRKSRIKGR
ncbi:MAG: DEAD/DEAH box helicase [Bdellovibrionota bacterium]